MKKYPLRSTPVDDGACAHLLGKSLPPLKFRATNDQFIDLSQLSTQRTVLYIYPMTAQPNVTLPESWDQIPGARGCTAQSCSFRDNFSELQAFNVSVFGLSAQKSEDQKEAATRLHLPFLLLSDPVLTLAQALKLPTFQVDHYTLYKRVTLVINDNKIEHYFYPVFPPEQNTNAVIEWLLQTGSTLHKNAPFLHGSLLNVRS